MERHKRAEAGRRCGCSGAATCGASARALARCHLQFQGDRGLRADFISQNVKDLLGYEPDEYLDSPDFWRSRLHPKDGERILSEYSRLFAEDALALNIAFKKRMGAIAGSVTNYNCCATRRAIRSR